MVYIVKKLIDEKNNQTWFVSKNSGTQKAKYKARSLNTKTWSKADQHKTSGDIAGTLLTRPYKLVQDRGRGKP